MHKESRSALGALVWATCVLLCVHTARGVSTSAQSAGQAMADTIVNALGGDVAKSKAVLELARTETSSAIRGLIARPAALAAADLHLTMDDTNGVGTKTTIAAVERRFTMLMNSAATAETAAAMRAARDETMGWLQDLGSDKKFADVLLFFKDNKGRYTAFSFIIRRVPPNKWQRQE